MRGQVGLEEKHSSQNAQSTALATIDLPHYQLAQEPMLPSISISVLFYDLLWYTKLVQNMNYYDVFETCFRLLTLVIFVVFRNFFLTCQHLVLDLASLKSDMNLEKPSLNSDLELELPSLKSELD